MHNSTMINEKCFWLQVELYTDAETFHLMGMS